jgi:polysaccharide chain length determinant protein (PEP-CTERM system associated)
MNEILALIRREIVGAWRFRWWAMAVAWCICVLGWLAIYAMPDTYEASARFFVETRSRLDRVIGEVVVQDQIGGQVNLVKQAMLGRPVLEKVASATDLDLRAATTQQKNNLISALAQKIVITGSPGEERSPRPTDGIYTIAFRDEDRQMSLAVVSSLLDEFMDDVARGRQDSSDETIDFLRSEITKYNEQLRQREQALADFKQENVGLLPGDGGGYFNRLQIELDELGVLEAQLENAQSRRAALQAQLRGANPYAPSDDDSSTGGPAGPRTDLDGRILELETQLDELLLRFTDRHPDVVATKEQLAQLGRRRDEQIELLRNSGSGDTAVLSSNPVYQQLSISMNEVNVEIAGLQSQLARDRRKIADLRNKVDVIPAIEAQLTELTRDYDQVRLTYEEMRRLLEQEVIAARKQQAAVVNFRLIDPPFVGTQPVSPKRAIMLLAIFALGVGAGGGVAWLLHLLKPVFHDVADLRAATGLPVLGAVSMTWIERHHAQRKSELTSYAMVGCMLVGSFIVVYLFRGPGGSFVRQLVG